MKKAFFFFVDLYLIAAFFIFLTGGMPFISAELQQLIGRKPWMHRAAIAALSAIALLLFKLFPGNKVPVFFSRLPVSPKNWTLIIFLYLSLIGTASSWARHEVFHSSFDMAIFTQAVWNTLHSHFLFSSIKGGINLLGDHFSPILAALALPYAVWPDAKLLLLVQAVAAAATVFPLYRIAADKLKNSWAPLLFVAALALYQPLRNSVRFDFHPEVLVMPLWLWAFYFQEKRKAPAASIFLALCLLSKESAALITFVMGFYAAFLSENKSRVYGFFWMIFSAAYFTAAIKWMIPYFSKQEYFYLSGNFLAWGQMGAGDLFKYVASPVSVSYLVKIFAPVGFLSILHPPTLLLAGPMILQNLLSRNESVRNIFFHYTAYLTPFVFLSAVYGYARIQNWRGAGLYLAAWALLFAGIQEPYILKTHLEKRTPHFKIIKEEMTRIPPNISVRTHEFFAAHLANRKELHIFENNNPKEGGSEAAMNARFVVIDRMFLGQNMETETQKLRERGYSILKERDGFTVLERG